MIEFESIKANIEKFNKLASDSNSKLCAVIKLRSLEEINYAINDCGVKLVGENHVQELLEHYDLLRNSNCEIHFIGHLQTNKVKYIIDKVDLIESLDSLHLADEIEKQAAKKDICIKSLIEINIAEEEQKSGVLPSEAKKVFEELKKYKHIKPIGLMTVGPVLENTKEYIPFFMKTRELLEEFSRVYPDVDKPMISMGMSNSYLEALECGTSEIRIGSGIFGPRDYSKK